MKKFLLISFLFSFLVFPELVSGKTNPSTVTVELNYGSIKESRSIIVPWTQGMTALEALMHAADVLTHPVGDYVFVTSIDSVKGERGVMAWYYKINGESTKKLAISREVEKGDTISWFYVKDVCSATVDKK